MFEIVDDPPHVRLLGYSQSTRLRNKESLSASEASKRARNELEDAEEKAQLALVRNCIGYPMA